MLSKLRLVQTSLFLKHNCRAGDFAEARVRNSVDRHFAHTGMLGNRVFYFGAADVLASTNYNVLSSVEQDKKTQAVEHADIAGVEPAVLDYLGGSLRLIPVAMHHRGAFNADLANAAGGQLCAALVDYAHAGDRRGRSSGAIRSGEVEHTRDNRADGIGLGKTVAQTGNGFLGEFLNDEVKVLGWSWCAAGLNAAQAR